jgi:hypothetical protein
MICGGVLPQGAPISVGKPWPHSDIAALPSAHRRLLVLCHSSLACSSAAARILSSMSSSYTGTLVVSSRHTWDHVLILRSRQGSLPPLRASGSLTLAFQPAISSSSSSSLILINPSWSLFLRSKLLWQDVPFAFSALVLLSQHSSLRAFFILLPWEVWYYRTIRAVAPRSDY